MNNFVLGRYVPGDSYIYKIDPRCKILTTFILMIAVFFLENIYEVLGAIGLIIVLLLTARLSIFKVLKSLKAIIMLSLIVFVFQLIFNKEGEIIYTAPFNISYITIGVLVFIIMLLYVVNKFNKHKMTMFILSLALIIAEFILINYDTFVTLNLDIYEGGLYTSLFVLFRLIAVILLATILTITTKPTDLTLAFEWLFKPLKIFKIEPEEVALIITIALRYIPTILDEANKIMDSQASRGADFKNANLFKKIKQIVSLLVPMFVISFERSDELSDAMIVRNYVPGKKKTRYHILAWKALDTVTIIVSSILLGGAICLMIVF